MTALPPEIAAAGFPLPTGYRALLSAGAGALPGWRLLAGEAFLAAYAAANARGAERLLLPFAHRSTDGALACFEALPGPPEAVEVLDPRGHARARARTFAAFLRGELRAVPAEATAADAPALCAPARG
ncbi:MAG: hypothetical protein D6731_03680 [Planctomycetota bacterium]|nr:MAG: hypothetical protein D6731_03680 [Planctomycetota bacterium]